MSLQCLLATAFLAASGTALAAPRQPAIASGGRSAYVIVLPDQPTAPERSAARELQRCLRIGTGATLRIVPERQARSLSRRIFVGQINAARRLVPARALRDLGADGIVLWTAGADLVLTGGRPRGVLYAVYEFLHRYAGARWWDDVTETIPRRAVLPLPRVALRYVPRIVCREPHFHLPNNSPAWNARNRVNGHFTRVGPELGGHMRILGWCHTFYELIPPAQHFATNPEWFSEIGGRRTADRAQLCLTNEQMTEELTRRALEWVRREPEAGFISISQNDWFGRCECARCLAVEREEGAPSGPMVRFVNRVAERIEREFPNFLVETLAYQYTRQAPRLARPRRNVVIRLCSIEADYGLPLEHPRNREFVDDLRAWSAIAPNLYIWTYVARFGEYWYPNPCLPVYARNIRLFAANRAVGVFVQGDAYNASSCFVRMRAWVVARLLWDPSEDQTRLEDEFLRGYYGAAAPHLRAYLRLVEAAYARRRDDRFMTPSDVLEGYRLFARAEQAVARDAKLAERVRRERFPLDYLWASEHRRLLRAARDAGVTPSGPQTPLEAVQALREAAARWGNGFRAEGQPAGPWLDSWVATLAIPAGPPPQLAGVAPERIVDLQEPHFRLYNVGAWVDLVDDPAASNRKAAFLRPGHTQWAVQAQTPDEVTGRVRVMLALRVEADETASGVAASCGVYDSAANRGLTQRDLRVEELLGSEYRWVDLGPVSLGPAAYVWVAPAAGAQGVRGIWVDRIVLVRE